MTNIDKMSLDAPTIDEVVGGIGYDVLDSILEDGLFEDKEFKDTMERFNDAIFENSLDFMHQDYSNIPDCDIEASLEPIVLDDNVKSSLVSIIDNHQTLNKGEESANTKCADELSNHQNLSNAHSYLNKYKPRELSMRDDGAECSFQYLSQQQAQKSLITINTTSSQQIDTLFNHPASFESKSGLLQCLDKHNSLSMNANTPTTSGILKTSTKAKSPLLEEKKYRDLSMITDEEAVAHIKYDNMRGRTKELFPVKLHKLIEHSERYGFSSIISWSPHGRALKIYDENRFIEKVLPHFFYQSKMSSFTRQLRMYGFHKIKGKSNVDKGAYYHELFLRGRPGLSHGITRLDKPVSLHRKDEPSFYLFPPMPSSHHDDHRTLKADTNPRCIRFTDCPSVGNPSPADIGSKSVTSGVKNKNISHATVQAKNAAIIDAAKSSMQMNMNARIQPQLANESSEKNIQVVYVFYERPPFGANSYLSAHSKAQRKFM